MSLVIETNIIRQLVLGERDRFADGCLQVDASALQAALQADNEVIERVTVHAVAPGDATRIHCCKDVVQPAVKLDGETCAAGRRRVLENLAVVTCGPIVGFQEGIIDMSGPGADYTPFSDLLLLVLEFEVADTVTPHEHEAAVREAGLAAAEHLAQICAEAAPQSSKTVLWNETTVEPDLPRIAYVCMVLSQGLLHDTWVLGRNAQQDLPRIVDPRIFLDGGVISGNCVSACDKNTSYHHANNPLVKILLAGHGQRWNFVGVVITNQPVRLAQKEQNASTAASMVMELDANGAIVTKEGFGNPDSDFMMILRLLGQADIACVGVTDEFAGSSGGSQSLADATPLADAIVSTGNANQRVLLPALAHTIGAVPDVERLAGGYAGSIKPDGSLEVELQAIMGATNELGFGTLSAMEI
jgi:sarcosine reductase